MCGNNAAAQLTVNVASTKIKTEKHQNPFYFYVAIVGHKHNLKDMAEFSLVLFPTTRNSYICGVS